MNAMNAETLNCPMCGASISSDAPQCLYCEAKLATVACSSCFGMMFLGSKHCPRCGASAATLNEVTSAGKHCPRCKSAMELKTLADTKLLECPHCLGLWLQSAAFEKICADREQQSAVLGAATLSSDRKVADAKISYIPCPECGVLMNRANFARCSGVIIDLCKRHGVWFDRDELSRIIEFIREGGLELSRTKEKMQLEEERRRLEQLRTETQRTEAFFDTEHNITGIASTRSLLKLLLR